MSSVVAVLTRWHYLPCSDVVVRAQLEFDILTIARRVRRRWKWAAARGKAGGGVAGPAALPDDDDEDDEGISEAPDHIVDAVTSTALTSKVYATLSDDALKMRLSGLGTALGKDDAHAIILPGAFVAGVGLRGCP